MEKSRWRQWLAIKPRYLGNHASKIKSYYGTISGSHGRFFRIRHEKSPETPPGGGQTMTSYPVDVLGMTLNCIHMFIVTGSFLYWCGMRPASMRFFILSCIYQRILVISFLATFLGTNSLSVRMCRKAVNQSYAVGNKPRYLGNNAWQLKSYYGTLSGYHAHSFRIRHKKSPEAPPGGEITMTSYPVGN